MLRHNKAFTLIELLVVIFIISLLVGLIVPNMMEARKRARDARRKEDLETMRTALRLYYNDYQAYPTPPLPFGTGGLSPYILNFPQDPVSGNTYYYCVDGAADKFILGAELENAADPDLSKSQSSCSESSICDTACDPASDYCYFVCAN